MEPLHTQKISRMSSGPSRSDGKVVDEWTFHAARPGGRDTPGIEIKIKVSLVNAKEGLAFRAKIPEIGVFEDSDIQKLHEKIEKTLTRHSELVLGAVWEDWLEVTVANDDWREKSTLSSALSIVVKPVKRGVDPKTGLAYLLSDHGLHPVPMGKKSTFHSTQSGGLGIRLEENKEISYVPATRENIAALTDARDRMILLRTRLAQAFSQENISETLEKITASPTFLALSAPEDAQNEANGPARKGPRP